MPAIQIERLKAQIQLIMNPAFTPEIFVIGLRSFMEAHANLAYRTSPEALQKQQVESYQIAPVIQTQLNLSIQQFTLTHPLIAFSYVDMLWQEPYIEMKALAGEILGSLPKENSDLVLRKILSWSAEPSNKALRKIIFNTSTKSIRAQNMLAWQNTIKKWLDSVSTNQILTALQALMILVHDPQYDNYPFIFKAISEISLKQGEKTNNALTELLIELVHENQKETYVFLKSMLLSNPSPELSRIVRRSLSTFSSEHQGQFRQIMKG